MPKPLSRRKLIRLDLRRPQVFGLGVAAYLAGKNGLIPPDHGGIYGVGETLTYASQRLLMSRHSLAREFDRSQISKVFPVNGDPPGDRNLPAPLSASFLDWRLTVDGLVAHPASFLARRSQALSFPQPDHPSGLRRGLVLHRRMDRCSSLLRSESGRSSAASEIRGLFPFQDDRGTAWICSTRCIRKRCSLTP